MFFRGQKVRSHRLALCGSFTKSLPGSSATNLIGCFFTNKRFCGKRGVLAFPRISSVTKREFPILKLNGLYHHPHSLTGSSFALCKSRAVKQTSILTEATKTNHTGFASIFHVLVWFFGILGCFYLLWLYYRLSRDFLSAKAEILAVEIVLRSHARQMEARAIFQRSASLTRKIFAPIMRGFERFG